MKNSNLFLSLLLIALALLTACNQKSGPPASSPDGRHRIALIMKSLANEFFKTMQEGAEAHQREHSSDYELLAVGIKDELDVSRQVELVEQMIAQRVDAMVIAPADSKALIAVCKKAQDAGLVVVNIDNKLDAGVLVERNLKIPFVGPDNRKGARMAGEHLAGKLKPGDEVAIIEGVPTAFNAIQRKAGFEDAVRAGGLNIVSSQSGNWETAKANQVAAAVITERPGLRAFLCANDSMALGAVAALKAAGKSDQVYVVGFDNITAIQQLIHDGKVLATVDQHGDQIAVYGIEHALDILKKKSAPADRETPVDLITRESLK
jgi:ribose transport system substrate-binding protein